MTSRRHSHQPIRRWALWAFALALLLKAAVPLLATASAHVQGKTLVEVCTVYGVATVALDGLDSAPASNQPTDHGQAHGGEHCALSGVAALATPPVALPALAAVAQLGAVPLSHPSSQAPDACATWVARLKHGPPAFS